MQSDFQIFNGLQQPAVRVLSVSWSKTAAWHAERHRCMFYTVLQRTNRCGTVELDRNPEILAALTGKVTSSGAGSVLVGRSPVVVAA